MHPSPRSGRAAQSHRLIPSHSSSLETVPCLPVDRPSNSSAARQRWPPCRSAPAPRTTAKEFRIGWQKGGVFALAKASGAIEKRLEHARHQGYVGRVHLGPAAARGAGRQCDWTSARPATSPRSSRRQLVATCSMWQRARAASPARPSWSKPTRRSRRWPTSRARRSPTSAARAPATLR